MYQYDIIHSRTFETQKQQKQSKEKNAMGVLQEPQQLITKNKRHQRKVKTS